MKKNTCVRIDTEKSTWMKIYAAKHEMHGNEAYELAIDEFRARHEKEEK